MITNEVERREIKKIRKVTQYPYQKSKMQRKHQGKKKTPLHLLDFSSWRDI